MMQMHPYPALNQLSHVYEQQQSAKELNKYASLKVVGKDVHSKGSFLAYVLYSRVDLLYCEKLINYSSYWT